jgi:hypothetical protein
MKQPTPALPVSGAVTASANQDDSLLRASLRRKYIQETVILANRKIENEAARLNSVGTAGDVPIRQERRKPSVKINVPPSAVSADDSSIIGTKRITWKLPATTPSVKKSNRERLAAGRRRIRKLSAEEREALYQHRPDLRPARKNQSLEAEADVIDGATGSRGAFSATRAIGSFFGTAVTALHEYAYGGGSDSSDDESDDSSQGSCESSDSYASESNSERSDNESVASELDLSPRRKIKKSPERDGISNKPLNPVPSRFHDESTNILLSDAKRKQEKTDHLQESAAPPMSRDGAPLVPVTARSNVSGKMKRRTLQAQSKGESPSVKIDEPSRIFSSSKPPMTHPVNAPSPRTVKNIRQRMAAHRSLEVLTAELSDTSYSTPSPSNLTTPSDARRRRRRDIKKQMSIGEMVTKFVNDTESTKGTPLTARTSKSKAACQMQSAEVLMDLVTSEPVGPGTVSTSNEDLVAHSSVSKSPRRCKNRSTSASNKDTTSKKKNTPASPFSNADILESLELHEQSGNGHTRSSNKNVSTSAPVNSKRTGARTVRMHVDCSSSTPSSLNESAPRSESGPNSRDGGTEKHAGFPLYQADANDENMTTGNIALSSFASGRGTRRRSPIALRSREFRMARLTLTGSSTSPRLTENKSQDVPLL